MTSIDPMRVDARDRDATSLPGFRARFEPLGLARRAAKPVAPTAIAPTWRRWIDHAVRLVRDAAIVVGLMAVVPVAIVAVRGDDLARILDPSGNTRERIEFAQRARAFALPADPAITPMEAGLALNALQRPGAKADHFATIEPAVRPARSWQSMAMPIEMLATARPDIFSVPSSRSILEATRRGLSPREMEYLRTLATAPVWREFDLVARAPAVDVVGGQFRTPFGEGARAEQRPLPKFGDARELAHAAVSRAAYHLAIGQRDSAEAVLRSIVSFGFAFIDNGPGIIDEMIGTVIVGVGRDGLQRYYASQGDPRAGLAALQAPPKNAYLAAAGHADRATADEVQKRLIARLEDPNVPRGERFEIARMLSGASCTTVRDLLFGPRAEVLDAIERARRSLPRYASERALMDLQTQPFDVPMGNMSSHPFQTLAGSAASVAGTVLRNPRLESCTLLLTGWSR